jgi:ribosomal protein S18 acetylase RimI-like enzyme
MKDQSFSLESPRVAGLTWRALERNDLQAVVDLSRACFLADGGLHFMAEAEEVTNWFFPDEAAAAIGAFDAKGSLAACATVYPFGKTRQSARILGQVRPEYRGRGIGDRLMDWSEEQADRMLDAVGPGERLLQIRTEWLNEAASRLYDAHGFKLANDDLVMRRELDKQLPNSPLPARITLTAWRPELAGLFFEAYQAAFRDRPGFPGMTEREWVQNWTVDNDPFRPDWSFLARAGDEPAGFHMVSANPPHGFTMQVGVVPAWRRRGLSSAMMVESVRLMQAAGLVSSQLNVYTNNPGAIQNYLKLGYVTIGHRARFEKKIA